MTFVDILIAQVEGMFPDLLYFLVLGLVPFIVAEQKNFADALPIFDILFGTYHRPARDEFPATGLGPAFPAPRSIWSAQLGPLLAVGRMLWAKRWEPACSGKPEQGDGVEKA